MTHLKSKSEMNLVGANLLISSKIYAPSIHCSYYSSVQLMIHILVLNLNKTELDIDTESRKARTGFHNWLKSKIIGELKNRNPKIIRDFNNSFGIIKALRIKADYKNSTINKQKAIHSVEKAKTVNKILAENFTI